MPEALAVDVAEGPARWLLAPLAAATTMCSGLAHRLFSSKALSNQTRGIECALPGSLAKQGLDFASFKEGFVFWSGLE